MIIDELERLHNEQDKKGFQNAIQPIFDLLV